MPKLPSNIFVKLYDVHALAALHCNVIWGRIALPSPVVARAPTPKAPANPALAPDHVMVLDFSDMILKPNNNPTSLLSTA